MSDDWQTVPKRHSNHTASSPASAGNGLQGLSKSQKKNLRRKYNRAAVLCTPSLEAPPEDVDPILRRAIEESIQTASPPHVDSVRSSDAVTIGRIQKKLKAIAKLEQRMATGSTLTEEEFAKLGRKAQLEEELLQVETEMAEAEAAVIAAKEDEKQGMANVQKVIFDTDKYGCPICCDVLDAATMVLPCEHIFCRECIEEALTRSIKPYMTIPQRMEAVMCPLCRTKLFNKAKQKVLTKPAQKLRKKIAKATGICHCGKEMQLGALREHQRQCGPGAAIFGERKQFKNEFQQPPVLVAAVKEDWKWTGREYNEEDAIQQAIAESLGSNDDHFVDFDM